jgi:predicted RNA binding protein YcfA (HicA-like mRNA interferase family)
LYNGRKTSTFAASDHIYDNMKRYKVNEIIKMLIADGWYLEIQEESHRQFKHPLKKGRVTENGKHSLVLSQYLLNSIFKQAGWR